MPVPEPALPIFISTSATWTFETVASHMFYTDTAGDIVSITPSFTGSFGEVFIVSDNQIVPSFEWVYMELDATDTDVTAFIGPSNSIVDIDLSSLVYLKHIDLFSNLLPVVHIVSANIIENLSVASNSLATAELDYLGSQLLLGSPLGPPGLFDVSGNPGTLSASIESDLVTAGWTVST